MLLPSIVYIPMSQFPMDGYDGTSVKEGGCFPPSPCLFALVHLAESIPPLGIFDCQYFDRDEAMEIRLCPSQKTSIT